MPMTFAARGRSLSVRTVGFAAVWVVLFGPAPAALPVGLATACAAAWASVRLLPGALRPSPWRAALLGLRFVGQSAAAGFDVARRALDPRLPLAPGLVRYRPRLPPGPALNAFCAWSSLLPGSLPCGIDADGAVLLHCLDTTQPIAAQLAAEEARFVAALGLDG